jgi:hypothetical protein
MAQPLPTLDGRRFVMESSTASIVDPGSPSRFHYHEQDGLVWGDYAGDTVTIGHFVGSRVGDVLSVTFAHVIAATGAVVTGASDSTVKTADDGRLRLVEAFRIDGIDHVSICIEVP